MKRILARLKWFYLGLGLSEHYHRMAARLILFLMHYSHNNRARYWQLDSAFWYHYNRH